MHIDCIDMYRYVYVFARAPPGPMFDSERVILEGKSKQVILLNDSRRKFAMQKQITSFRQFEKMLPSSDKNLVLVNLP